jgi:AbrB family looped-hinge helix DNA binding protein
MTSVALSPKFQLVIPKDVRKLFNLIPGQQMQVRANLGKIEITPEIPMQALRGMCPGIDTVVPNDIETGSWPGGCEPL